MKELMGLQDTLNVLVAERRYERYGVFIATYNGIAFTK
jgi:hypothetical protein